MGPTSHALLMPLAFLVAIGGVSALNITHLLEPVPEFATFCQFLNRTGLLPEINSRRTITVLALDNGAMGAVAGLEEDVAADVLRLHVILDYYDLDKLHRMKKRTTILTTLFQTTGHAANMGFLNATIQTDGTILMGSSAPHEPLSSRVVKMVLTRPYNISILQLDSAIIPQGLDGFTHPVSPPSPPPPPSPPQAPAPAEAPGPVDDGSSDDDATPPSPTEAPAPAAEEPASPSPSPEEPAVAPAADGPEAADDDGKSAGWRVVAGGSMVATMVTAMIMCWL